MNLLTAENIEKSFTERKLLNGRRYLSAITALRGSILSIDVLFAVHWNGEFLVECSIRKILVKVKGTKAFTVGKYISDQTEFYYRL